MTKLKKFKGFRCVQRFPEGFPCRIGNFNVIYFSIHAGILLCGLGLFVQGWDFLNGARIIMAGVAVFLVGCVLNLLVLRTIFEILRHGYPLPSSLLNGKPWPSDGKWPDCEDEDES